MILHSDKAGFAILEEVGFENYKPDQLSDTLRLLKQKFYSTISHERMQINLPF